MLFSAGSLAGCVDCGVVAVVVSDALVSEAMVAVTVVGSVSAGFLFLPTKATIATMMPMITAAAITITSMLEIRLFLLVCSLLSMRSRSMAFGSWSS